MAKKKKNPGNTLKNLKTGKEKEEINDIGIAEETKMPGVTSKSMMNMETVPALNSPR